uniref:Uncharacterized protein n=1 Tax=Arundo donax TaxID=35708 RepID=A0A0A9AZT8_ARUDO
MLIFGYTIILESLYGSVLQWKLR